jgi:hypothetical protein
VHARPFSSGGRRSTGSGHHPMLAEVVTTTPFRPRRLAGAQGPQASPGCSPRPSPRARGGVGQQPLRRCRPDVRTAPGQAVGCAGREFVASCCGRGARPPSGPVASVSRAPPRCPIGIFDSVSAGSPWRGR